MTLQQVVKFVCAVAKVASASAKAAFEKIILDDVVRVVGIGVD